MLAPAVLALLAAGSVGDAFPPLATGIANPRAIAVSPAGRILVAANNPNGLYEIAAGGLRVLRFEPVQRTFLLPLAPEVPPQFAGVAVCSDGNVFLSVGPEVVQLQQPGVWNSIPLISDHPKVRRPAGLACDAERRLVIADPGSDRVWRFDPAQRTLTAIAGIGLPGDSGDGGAAVRARLSSPESVAVAADGTVFVADRGNRRVRWIRRDDTIGGSAPGSFVDPTGVAWLSVDRVAVADAGAHRVYEVRVSTGKITPIAGDGVAGFAGDRGQALSARLHRPFAVAAAPDGSLLLADAENRRVRAVAPAGSLATIAGNGRVGFAGDGQAAMSAPVAPTRLALDATGNLYVVEAAHHRIRRIDRRTRVITTVAGTGMPGDRGDGGPAVDAELNLPSAVAVAPEGTVYVGDTGNRRIRRISPAGTIDTLTGGWSEDCCATQSLAWSGGALVIAERFIVYRQPLPSGPRSRMWARATPSDGAPRPGGAGVERIDAMAVADDLAYLGTFRPGAFHRLDLASGILTTVTDGRVAHPGLTEAAGPIAMALASARGPLFFGTVGDPAVYRARLDETRALAHVERLAALPGPGRPSVLAIAASADEVYFADAFRVFRLDGVGAPEQVAGGSRGF